MKYIKLFEELQTKKYYKVVTQDMKSLGLRRNPNIMTFEVGKWIYEKPENNDRTSNDFGGIWVAQSLSGAKSLIKYLKKKAIKENKPELNNCRLFEVEIGEILYQNSYRVKTDKVKFIKEL